METTRRVGKGRDGVHESNVSMRWAVSIRGEAFVRILPLKLALFRAWMS